MQYSQSTATLRRLLLRHFRPGWGPSLIVLVLLPVLLGLGWWQLGRAEDKRELLAQMERQSSAAPASLEQLLAEGAPAFRRVLLEGRFDAQHSLLLDNRTRLGQPGVELLQPFEEQGGHWLLINRGWLPWPDRRQMPAFDTPGRRLALTAWVYRPPRSPIVLKNPAGESWPRLINRVDAPALWQELKRDGLPFELRLEPGPAAYAVNWPTVTLNPEQHLGYAVQWFSLAAALFVLFVYLGIRHAQETRHASSRHPD